MLRSPLRILLVEPHDLTRRGAIALLADEGFEVVGAASSMAEARAIACRVVFDLWIIEPHLPDGDGTHLISALGSRAPRPLALILTAHPDADDALRALRAGASGYIAKDTPSDRLGETIRSVARGEAALSRELTAHLIRELRRLNAEAGRESELQARLTRREWEVLELMADGHGTAEIVAQLHVSVETARSHIKAVLRKLEVHDRQAAVALLASARASSHGDAAEGQNGRGERGRTLRVIPTVARR